MNQKQLSDLLYSIGETLLMEVDDIKRVHYKDNTEFPDTIFIELNNGERYELYLHRQGEY